MVTTKNQQVCVVERPQIGTAQTVGYIGVTSPTEGQRHAPNQLLELTANDTCHRDIFKTLYSTVQSQSVVWSVPASHPTSLVVAVVWY